MNHTLRILNRSGDVAVAWAPEDKASVDTAKAKFEALLAQDYLLFETKAPGQIPEQVKEFNPQAFEIVASKRFIGG